MIFRDPTFGRVRIREILEVKLAPAIRMIVQNPGGIASRHGADDFAGLDWTVIDVDEILHGRISGISGRPLRT